MSGINASISFSGYGKMSATSLIGQMLGVNFMETTVWTWGDGKPSIAGVGQDYDVYTLYLYVRGHGHLPPDLSFAGLIWVALEAQKRGDLEAGEAVTYLVNKSCGKLKREEMARLLRMDSPPQLPQTDWRKLSAILDLPILLMEAAVVTID